MKRPHSFAFAIRHFSYDGMSCLQWLGELSGTVDLPSCMDIPGQNLLRNQTRNWMVRDKIFCVVVLLLNLLCTFHSVWSFILPWNTIYLKWSRRFPKEGTVKYYFGCPQISLLVEILNLQLNFFCIVSLHCRQTSLQCQCCGIVCQINQRQLHYFSWHSAAE